MSETAVLGAVAYDPKVVTIWEGFKRVLDARGVPFDVVLYTSYERQVEAHLAGHVNVAWNSPLAWLEAERVARARGRVARALCMRDTDRDLTSLVLVRADAPIRTLADLKGKRVAVGASDSPQATLIPLGHLRRAGLTPGGDVEVLRHEVLVGKHGDHIGGERDAARALVEGRADAACLIDVNHLAFARDGTLPPNATRVLSQTGRYDHCNMTALDGAPPIVDRFIAALLAMRYDDAEVRPLLDLEGLKRWLPGRTSGYALHDEAVDALGAIDPWLRAQGAA
jgi:phosphonate transport system substrate-binding protein